MSLNENGLDSNIVRYYTLRLSFVRQYSHLLYRCTTSSYRQCIKDQLAYINLEYGILHK